MKGRIDLLNEEQLSHPMEGLMEGEIETIPRFTQPLVEHETDASLQKHLKNKPEQSQFNKFHSGETQQHAGVEQDNMVSSTASPARRERRRGRRSQRSAGV